MEQKRRRRGQVERGAITLVQRVWMLAQKKRPGARNILPNIFMKRSDHTQTQRHSLRIISRAADDEAHVRSGCLQYVWPCHVRRMLTECRRADVNNNKKTPPQPTLVASMPSHTGMCRSMKMMLKPLLWVAPEDPLDPFHSANPREPFPSANPPAPALPAEHVLPDFDSAPAPPPTPLAADPPAVTDPNPLLSPPKPNPPAPPPPPIEAVSVFPAF